MSTTCIPTRKASKSRMIGVPLLRGPFPTEEEFDARLRSLGFRPATSVERNASKRAQARIHRAVV